MRPPFCPEEVEPDAARFRHRPSRGALTWGRGRMRDCWVEPTTHRRRQKRSTSEPSYIVHKAKTPGGEPGVFVCRAAEAQARARAFSWSYSACVIVPALSRSAAFAISSAGLAPAPATDCT